MSKARLNVIDHATLPQTMVSVTDEKPSPSPPCSRLYSTRSQLGRLQEHHFVVFMSGQRRRQWLNFKPTQSQRLMSASRISQQTQNICITFVQRRHNVFDVGPTLYKCYRNVLCLPGYAPIGWQSVRRCVHLSHLRLFHHRGVS